MPAKQSDRDSAAFTLVELLVVVAVIALLVSLLMPSLGKATEAARRVSCTARQRQIATAFFAYAGEHFGVFPAVHYRDPTGKALCYSEVPHGWAATTALMLRGQYLGNSLDVFFCPSYSLANTTYYRTNAGMFEFNTAWRTYLPDRRLTSYAAATSIVLDPATNPYSQIKLPLGSQRLVRVNDRPGNRMLLADLLLSVTNDWYVPGFVGFSSPAHTVSPGGPAEGGNVALNDGSAGWRPFGQMQLRYYYQGSDPTGRREIWW